MTDAEVAERMAALAQRWHETDHGTMRGKRLRRTAFLVPRDDDFDPEAVPPSFRDCELCNPAVAWQGHNNPYWYRVIAWESDNQSPTGSAAASR